MRIHLIFFLVLFIGHTAWGQHYIEIKNLKGLKKFLKYTPKDALPLISAHRGGVAKGFPENCIATFDNTLKITPAIIECDILMTQDSVLIMMHDKELNRTTDTIGSIAQFKWEMLKKRKLKDAEGDITPYNIPTLEDVLQWGKGKTLLNLDIKPDFPAQFLVKAIQKAKAHHYAVVITYNFEQAQKIYQLDKNICLSVSFKDIKDWEAFEKTNIPPSQVIAFVGVGRVNKELVDFLHKKNIMTILGTMGKVDNLAEQQGSQVFGNIYAQGIDMISSDKVRIVAEYIQKNQRREANIKLSKKQAFFKKEKNNSNTK